MEAQTEIQSYLERGKQALAEGQPREAAIAFAHAAQIDPQNPKVHLGLAEANLGLGDYRVVTLACQKVEELQPEGGPESLLARALLALLEKRYEQALAYVDQYVAQEPANAYAHALRSYLLQALGQYYDAGLARSRAARLSYGGRFERAFPPLEESFGFGYRGAPTPAGPAAGPSQPHQTESAPWSQRGQLQRQVTRGRFILSRYPRLVTNTLIFINIAVFLVEVILSQSLFIDSNVLYQMGGEVSQIGDYWRILTAMFLHANILHIFLNMLSLFLIGSATELFYGKLRYLVIYLASGIVGGLATYFLMPATVLSVGASGAIFGVFGALGAFYITNRRALGPFGQGAIINWLFWLGLNLALGFAPGSNIAVSDHIGGLITGLILGLLLGRPLERRML
ncbi:rhomboid family intramembrane serine protease [Thermogemmatispora sp.]|uniref:rhomboid family intramembrane serine protease n=1 Tax=Thermogemmatispora sp. TaxID=1968838 RepID=UPI0035E44DC8